MRPSAFHVLCPCLTKITLFASLMGGKGIGDESSLSFKSVNWSTSVQQYSCFRTSVSTIAAEHMGLPAFPTNFFGFNAGEFLNDGHVMIHGQ